jgi:hypothetical protein
MDDDRLRLSDSWSDMIDGLIDHLERYLGPIAGGWTDDPDGNPMPFQLVHNRQAGNGTDTYGTLGLSEHLLMSPITGDDHRIELIMLAPAATNDPTPVLASLLGIGATLIRVHEAPSVGDLFRNVGPLRQISAMDTLYAGRVLLWPREFADFGEGTSRVSPLWLMPVSEAEAHYVREHGWSEFEKLLIEHDPDPADFHRPSLVA